MAFAVEHRNGYQRKPDRRPMHWITLVPSLCLKVPPSWNRTDFATDLRAHGLGVVVADAFTVT